MGAISPCRACSSTVAPAASRETENVAWLSPYKAGCALWSIRVTNFGPVLGAAAAPAEDDPDAAAAPVFLVPGAGGSGVEAPSKSNLTVPSTTGRGPSLGLFLRCS